MKIDPVDATLADGEHPCHIQGMTQKPKRPRDANQLAKFVTDVATGNEPSYDADTSGQREGGLKGGRARAEKLSSKERSEIAKKAAKARDAVRN